MLDFYPEIALLLCGLSIIQTKVEPRYRGGHRNGGSFTGDNEGNEEKEF
jgi:hypothetical protein